MHILPNISRNKDNQAIKFGKLYDITKIFFFKNHAENEVRIRNFFWSVFSHIQFNYVKM